MNAATVLFCSIPTEVGGLGLGLWCGAGCLPGRTQPVALVGLGRNTPLNPPIKKQLIVELVQFLLLPSHPPGPSSNTSHFVFALHREQHSAMLEGSVELFWFGIATGEATIPVFSLSYPREMLHESPHCTAGGADDAGGANGDDGPP